MRITAYLLRTQVTFAKEILRDHQRYTECPVVSPENPEDAWRLFMYPGFAREVRWLKNIRPLFADEPPVAARGISPGAVLLIRTHGRVFAVTFGVGFHSVDDSVKEPDFGLLVAANSIDPDRVTLADARGLGKGRRNATSRLPTPNDMFALGLLTDEEWIRKFGGEVKLPGFAKTVSGADSLQLTIDDFDLVDLPQMLGKALELYASEDYRKLFAFLTYFRREADKATIRVLDERLADNMRGRDPEVGFALPDEFNLTADWYQLSRRRSSEGLSELLTDDVYDVIDKLDGWADPLNQVKVEAYDMSDGLVSDREPLRSYAVATVEHATDVAVRQYALTAGSWFRIDQEYVDLVDRYIDDRIVDLTESLALPDWDEKYLEENVQGKYGEDRYNKWVGADRGYGVLDQDFYRGRAGEQVEICDLLTSDKMLICVKRMDGSDKMSHLFQQGSVSAQLILANEAYRAQLMDRFHSLDASAQFGDARDWTVIYAIATSKPGALRDIMYFFSRAALKMHAEAVASRGFKVAIAKIHRT